MSNIAIPPRLALLPKHAREIMKTPSALVPEEVRPALFECWACHRHLPGMDTSLSLAALVATWINRFGLLPCDAAEILERIQHPDHCASHKFASDLTATLSGMVSQRLKQRRSEAEAEERRREHEAGERAKAELPEGFNLRAILFPDVEKPA